MKRIPSLDGLRAISIAMVCIGHLTRSWPIPNYLAVYALTGVRVFFVLSGYLITTLLLNEHDQTSTISLRQFYIRRAYRILPAAGVFMIFAVIAYWHELRWYDISAMLLFLSNFDLKLPWMVTHLWSLAVEEQFYLLWPSVLKKWYRHREAILIGTVAFAPIFSLAWYYFKVPGGDDSLYRMFPAVADTLAIGCLLAIWGPRLPRIPVWAAILMLLAVCFFPHFISDTRMRTLARLFVLTPILYCSIAGLVLHVIQTPYRVLNLGPVVWLGKISYSLYLWQQPFFLAAVRPPAYKLLLGVVLACLSYYFVEQPMLRMRGRKAPPPEKMEAPEMDLLAATPDFPSRSSLQ